MQRSIARDDLTCMSAKAMAQSAFSVIDGMQRMRRAEATAGLAAAFYLMCRRYDVDVNDIMQIVSNCMSEADAEGRPEFAAIRQYLANHM